MAMFEPLGRSGLGALHDDWQIYLQPACLVDRPHGLDGRCARIGDTLVWFAAWQLRVRHGLTVRQALVPIEALDDWIAAMPDALAAAASEQRDHIARPHVPLTLGQRIVRLSEPQIVGVLNATPDSFSDGGKHVDADAAADAGFALAAAGAAIVDVGGESTRPGAPVVWEGDELKRVMPVIERLASGGVAVSIDTRKAAVMEAALAGGAAMVNDISALLYDDRALEVVAGAGCPVVLMHAPSQSMNPHEGGDAYADPLLDVYDWLAARVAAVVAAGVARDRIVIDPGIGFGKGVAANLALLNGLPLFHGLGCPLMFGASRKRFIGALDGEAEADDRLGGSVAVHYQAASVGAAMVRVHDVRPMRQALRVWRGMRDAALTG